MKTIKKFLKYIFTFKNLLLAMYIMFLTYSMSMHSLKFALISGGIFILVITSMWLLMKYNKSFKDFFSK